jgi:peptidoglycan/xylan/chitin deacetylase (PgdA/CDA1 family)
MRARSTVCLMWLVTGVLMAPCRAAPLPGFHWPAGKRAAVSLAYDDALDSQLDIAVPALDRHGFKGSFYLTLSGATLQTRLAQWRAVAAAGHELGNHSLFHQCSGSIKGHEWVLPQRDLDSTTAAQMKDQVLLANAMLAAIDGQHRRSYTVPCGDVQAHGENYLELVKSEFVAIKFGDGAVVDNMTTLDPFAVPVQAPVGVTGKQLIATVEQAADQGPMVNFTFHGIGGDYLTVSAAAHEELLEYLSEHPDRYWVDTFLNIMTYTRQQQAQAAR